MMLDKETINTLRLIPEVDTEKADHYKFNNSDKQSLEVLLGSEEASRAAFFAIHLSTKGILQQG